MPYSSPLPRPTSPTALRGEKALAAGLPRHYVLRFFTRRRIVSPEHLLAARFVETRPAACGADRVRCCRKRHRPMPLSSRTDGALDGTTPYSTTWHCAGGAGFWPHLCAKSHRAGRRQRLRLLRVRCRTSAHHWPIPTETIRFAHASTRPCSVTGLRRRTGDDQDQRPRRDQQVPGLPARQQGDLADLRPHPEAYWGRVAIGFCAQLRRRQAPCRFHFRYAASKPAGWSGPRAYGLRMHPCRHGRAVNYVLSRRHHHLWGTGYRDPQLCSRSHRSHDPGR